MNANARQSILSLISSPPVLAVVLFGVNFYLCRELFTTEYLAILDSIEGAYVGLARWIMENPFEWKWFPLWYCGIPFQNAYPPLLHYLVAGVAAAGGLSPALAHHAVTATMYCLGPVTLFWFAHRLSDDRWTSFLAALFYTCISSSALLIPEIASDVGSALGSRRLHVLLRYGEGPHITSVALIPLALIALDWALQRRKPLPVFTAAVTMAAVVLTNWLGAFALAAGIVCYLLATLSQDWRRAVAWSAVIGMVAYLLASPWIPPSTIDAIRHNSQRIGGDYGWTLMHLAYAAAFGAAFLALWLIARKRSAAPVTQFSLLFLLFMGAPPLAAYWAETYVLPQPHRYHIEMEIPLALALVFGIGAMTRRLGRYVRLGVTAAGVLVMLAVLGPSRDITRWYTRPMAMEETVMYEAARFLDGNLRGERVFATGAVRFWLNAFSNNPQLGGGFDQGITNPQIPAVSYGLTTLTKDGDRAAAWLRSYSVRAVSLGGPDSRDPYKDYRDPAKFEGILPEIWRSAGDAVYRVPQEPPSLARVIREEEAVWHLPSPYVDASPLAAFDRAALDPERPRPEFQWLRTHHARIRAGLADGDLLAVAVTHHPGWSASVQGESRTIRRDALGLMVVDPACAGDCVVDLVYDGGTEMKLANLASAATILLGAGWGIWDFRRRRRLQI